MTPDALAAVAPASFRELIPDPAGLLAQIREAASAPGDRWHGERHWYGVARSGLRLLKRGTGGEAAIVLAFALFHDAFAASDRGWPRVEHGERAAGLVHALNNGDRPALDFDPAREALLCRALVDHSVGMTTDDPTIGTCWDADRLQLERFGHINVDPRLLSTQAAKVLDRDPGPPVDWSTLFAEYERAT